MSKLFILGLTAISIFVVAPALAQIPGSAEASRAAKQAQPLDEPLMKRPSAPLVSGTTAVAAPKGSEKVKFVLKSVKVDGNTAYSDEELEAALYGDLLGQTISLADVYGMSQELTAMYRNDGYILTRVVVPEQTISSGNIRLRVVEGFVNKVTIEGKTRNNTEFLQGYADRIRNDRPLNAKKLEKYVLLMNDLPGMTAKVVISPSATAVGGSDITIVVDQKAYDVFGQIDNRGSRYLGPMQLNAGTRLNNTFGFYEGLNLQAVTAYTHLDDREMDYLAFSWGMPLGHEGTRLSVGGSYTKTDPGHTLTPNEVEGRAKALSFELSHPFKRTRNSSFSAALKFNYLNNVRSDNVTPDSIVDHLRVLRASGTCQATDRFVGVNTATLELSKGIDWMGASKAGDANMTRAAGEPQFFKGTLEISRLQRITDIVDLFLSTAGQRSANTLLASEEFGVGGVNYGSAYDSSEITGEDGIAFRTELRANNPMAFSIQQAQFYGFYDIGKVWDRDNALPEQRRRALASAGLGFRGQVNENLAGTVEAAKPLTVDVGTEQDQNWRLFGSLTARF